MFGLTFLNLAFLAGIAAAAVPILIHLFSRRQAKRLDWPSIRFLKEINRQRIRRIRLRQLLLLLVRALAIVLFALAMGRPVLTGGFLSDGRAPSTVCLVIDTSYSMQAARGGASTFETARSQALGVVDQLGRDDGVYLISVSDRAESATPYPMQDLGLVRESIAALEPTDRAGDLASGLELAGRLLRASKNLNKEIYLITDLQASGWAALLDSVRTPVDLPPDVAVCVIAPGESQELDNVAIREVRARRQLADAGGLE
ncbi:MAG: BatA domain-containing protein, partial [Candidatus Eiseniibacteriota bacterium]